MKVTFVLPAIGKKPGQPYIQTWKMEPLTIATLKALTPPDVETEFFDDRIELIDYDTPTDLVAISVETYSAARAYEIARKYRQRGRKVILGGYHPTLVPDEALKMADSILTGNAEAVWPGVLEDLSRDNLQPVYHGDVGYRDHLPDRSIYVKKKYLPLNLVETGRGCPFACEFCAISSYYQSCYRPRDTRNIVRELERAAHKYTFFVDDNIAANPAFAGKLFSELAPLNIKWAGQGSLTIARDRKLLHQMRKSGCEILLIGFESLDEKNLDQMNKSWRYQLGEVDELVEAIHAEGIGIYATFVFGFDYDDAGSFDRALEFSMKHRFFFAAFNHLLPFPGTPLYARLKSENRLSEKWWLDPGYRYGDVAFVPRNMGAEELSERCASARREFFRLSSTFRRGIKLLGRNLDPMMSLIYWSQNLELRKEVDEKLRIPLGVGLDELPK